MRPSLSWIEHRFSKPRVGGSNPPGRAILFILGHNYLEIYLDGKYLKCLNYEYSKSNFELFVNK